MKKSNYLQLTVFPPVPIQISQDKPYRRYAFTGGDVLDGTNTGIEFLIPPTAYNGLRTNDLDVELILGHCERGIPFNVGFYTCEFDFGFINSNTTTNSKYQTMYMKIPQITVVERYIQPQRQKLRISGRPDVIRTKYQVNGEDNITNISNQFYIFKFTEV